MNYEHLDSVRSADCIETRTIFLYPDNRASRNQRGTTTPARYSVQVFQLESICGYSLISSPPVLSKHHNKHLEREKICKISYLEPVTVIIYHTTNYICR